MPTEYILFYMLSTLGPASPSVEAPTESPSLETEATDWGGRQRWPIIVAAGADSLGFFPQSAHFVGVLGTELLHVERRRFALVHPLEFGYLRHAEFAQGGSFDTGIEPRFISRVGVYAGLGLGIGVQHVFFPGTTYVATEEGYVAGGNRGRTSFRAKLSATLGYDFSHRTRAPVGLFVRYQQILLAPFAPKNDIPLMGRAQVLLGVTVGLAKRK